MIISWEPYCSHAVLTFITFHISSTPPGLLGCWWNNTNRKCQRTTGRARWLVYPLEKFSWNEFKSEFMILIIVRVFSHLSKYQRRLFWLDWSSENWFIKKYVPITLIRTVLFTSPPPPPPPLAWRTQLLHHLLLQAMQSCSLNILFLASSSPTSLRQTLSVGWHLNLLANRRLDYASPWNLWVVITFKPRQKF